MGGKEEMGVIINRWQSSKGCSIKASVMTSATLKLQVITKLDEDGTEHRVNIVKTYSRDSSSKVQIDGGYSIKERSSTSEAQSYLELTFDGNSIAYYIYEVVLLEPVYRMQSNRIWLILKLRWRFS